MPYIGSRFFFNLPNVNWNGRSSYRTTSYVCMYGYVCMYVCNADSTGMNCEYMRNHICMYACLFAYV